MPPPFLPPPHPHEIHQYQQRMMHMQQQQAMHSSQEAVPKPIIAKHSPPGYPEMPMTSAPSRPVKAPAMNHMPSPMTPAPAAQISHAVQPPTPQSSHPIQATQPMNPETSHGYAAPMVAPARAQNRPVFQAPSCSQQYPMPRTVNSGHPGYEEYYQVG